MFSSKLILLSIIAVVSVTAIPHGLTAYFDSDACPAGWEALNAAQGRIVVSVTDPSTTGVTVNAPLKDQEDRTHDHDFSVVINVPQRDIAAIGCCNNQGAHHGSYAINNSTLTGTSGYPFTQMLLCTFRGHNDTNPVAYGTVAYFSPTVSNCPENWAPMKESSGRILVPGYEQGSALPNNAAPLASGEDRTHQHGFNISIPTTDVSYAGAEGCCDSGPANYETLAMSSTAESKSTGLPYIQLLTCVSQAQTFNSTFPTDALVFSSISCPPGWDVVNEVSGRFLVALPNGGSPGASFGGNSVPSTGTGNPVHNHEIIGELTLPSVGVGLASGCCGSGYAAAATYSFHGMTSKNSDMLPYTMIPMCRNVASSVGKSTYLRKEALKQKL